MKVCVYGAGAVGGHTAALLHQAGAEVSVVARGAHLGATLQLENIYKGFDLTKAGESIRFVVVF